MLYVLRLKWQTGSAAHCRAAGAVRNGRALSYDRRRFAFGAKRRTMFVKDPTLPAVVAVAAVRGSERLPVAGQDLTVARMHLVGSRQIAEIFEDS